MQRSQSRTRRENSAGTELTYESGIEIEVRAIRVQCVVHLHQSAILVVCIGHDPDAMSPAAPIGPASHRNRSMRFSCR
jgi:hypothetical protein